MKSCEENNIQWKILKDKFSLQVFLEGVDVSSYLSLKNSGVKYYDYGGNELGNVEYFTFLKSCGVNYIRLRVWNDPYDSDGNGYGGGNNDLASAITMGKCSTSFMFVIPFRVK